MINKRLAGLSERTLEQYEVVIGLFRRYLDDDEVPANDIKPEHIRAYLSYLLEKDLKITTVAIRYRVLRAFFNWAKDEGYINESPLRNIPELKTPKKLPYVLTDEQVNRLLDTAKERANTWTGVRDLTIVSTLLEVGVRQTELVKAAIDDLDLARYSLKIHGKGAKDREVFFGKVLTRRLHRWLSVREDIPATIAEYTIFISLNGNSITLRNLDRIVANLKERAGLEDSHVTPQSLRHTSVTMHVNNGMDPYSLQQLFGWESIRTSERYVHASGKRLEEVAKRNSPVDSILRRRGRS